jgi:hypothetical protein
LSACQAPPQAAATGKPKRRQFKRRAARREAINRDIINLFRLKVALQYIEDGLSLGMVARMFGMSGSSLWYLKQRYELYGFAAVAPILANVLPSALSMDVFDPVSVTVGATRERDTACQKISRAEGLETKGPLPAGR